RALRPRRPGDRAALRTGRAARAQPVGRPDRARAPRPHRPARPAQRGERVMASVTYPANDTAGRTSRSVGSVVPGGDEVVDAVALIVLTMVGIVGFRPAYGGHSYLALGRARGGVGALPRPLRPG